MRLIVKIRMIVTANYAEIESDTQRINILGIAYQIPASRFPFVYRRLYLALILEGDHSTIEVTKALEIRLADEDGRIMSEVAGDFVMPAGSPGIPPIKGMVCEFNGLKFLSPGDYLLSIDVNDGELEASTVLRVYRHGT